MSEEIHTLSAPSVSLLLHVFRLKGLDTEALCRQAGLEPVHLQDVNNRVPVQNMQALWAAAIAASGDPDLALHAGEAVNPTSAGVIAYVMMNAATLHESLQKLCRYQDIVCEAIRTSLELKGEEAQIKLQVISPVLANPRHALDCELVVYKNAFEALVGQLVPLKQVLFVYPKPTSIAEHERLFAPATLVFDAPHSGFVLHADCLKLPVVTANQELNLVFEKYAQEYLQKLKEPKTLRERVQREITQLLKGEEPAINTVARNLAMSVRSLQSKLKEEGVTYQALLNDIRKEIALKHLHDNQNTIADIAYLLGFAEPSVFSRSFKKWTGLPPAQYRQQLAVA
ncbi:AraC family transcriptional regulator [Pontibacter qinzhouensis]|uniref:AraC family transcriptional regulator n=1 Tax=Pontibacter qinzhouensis TaxID=2603253 RepID=A0A5C8KDD2_9BACT|nr:AraC family transcriptional regulator [Pontibacter qinzhouensis]TXK52086.1 AraC family transcriptional regulator [Pontibacter qinzhouensis]